jgi:(5-formylfuran-3-yl)methyl phosphate synthase
MTQLLISVKNAQEAMLALAAEVDIIDLKDPNIGALGALDLAVTKEIVDLVTGKKLVSATQVSATQVSATIGEQHANVAELIADIQARADIGIDIIKIAISDLFQAYDFYNEIIKLTKTGIKIVAVFFADEALDLTLLPMLKNAGFYGAMLDTQKKHQHLLAFQTKNQLQQFIKLCEQHQLASGLAGSLQPQHIDLLLEINPTYIGFRGGVCENSQRKSTLNGAKVKDVQNMLRNGNKNRIKAQLILGLALHS